MIATAGAQEIKLPANLDQLAAKAKNVVDVTMDGPLLQLAGRFLSDKDPDEARAKRMVGNLKGIYVRSLEFDGPRRISGERRGPDPRAIEIARLDQSGGRAQQEGR